MNVFSWIYCKPLWEIYFLTLLAICLWTGLEAALDKIDSVRKKGAMSAWKISNGILMVLSLIGMGYYVLFYHRSQGEKLLYLMPFHFFQSGPVFEELYQMLVMNAFFFVPFGLTFSAVLPDKTAGWKKLIYTVAIGALMSVSIETIQFFTCRGVAETDDVIFNVIGAMLGGIHAVLTDIIKKNKLIDRCVSWFKE